MKEQLIILIFGLWSLWLECRILAVVHKISGWKAFFAIILSIIIISVIITAVAALYLMGVFSIGGGAGGGVFCSPCFTYFAYIDYEGGTLLIRNGAQPIEITDVTGADMPSQTIYDIGEDIILTGISTTGAVDITITYESITSGLPRTDFATIRQ